jgi:Raf kinase inhibitor-like YbhB/YbcL family protein
VPPGTRSLALLLEDPDAPGGTFLHWAVYRLPARADRLAAGRVPNGAVQGRNSFGKTGYGPPCPPKGDRAHRYVFTLYALRAAPKLAAGAPPADVRAGLTGAAAKGVLTARYGR